MNDLLWNLELARQPQENLNASSKSSSIADEGEFEEISLEGNDVRGTHYKNPSLGGEQ